MFYLIAEYSSFIKVTLNKQNLNIWNNGIYEEENMKKEIWRP